MNDDLALPFTRKGKACGRKSGAEILMRVYLIKPVSGAIIILRSLFHI
jgi:hypothetical protein